jgi:3-oxoacyl-[acyl-carrier-protein] synthase II
MDCMAEKDSPRREVAVTGLGTINSAGKNAEEYWQAVSSGKRDGVITNEREWLLQNTPAAYRSKLRSHLMGRVKSDDIVSELMAINEPAYDHIDERYAERYLSGSAIFGAIAVAEAMRSADAYDAVDPKRFAFVFGTGIGGGIHIAGFEEEFAAGRPLPPTGMPKTQPENAMIQMAIAYGAQGPSQTVTAACSSGNAAIINAAEKIRNNRADMIVAGGAEAFHPLILALFERTRAADTGEDPSLASRAFHPDAAGAIVSEGASMLVLEELEHAKARGAEVLALVAGVAETNDAADVTLLTGDGIEEAMRLALEEAGIDGSHYISPSAHATAAPRGDPAEARAIRNVFSRRGYSLEQIESRVTALKSITGHALGAANGSEAVAAVKTLTEEKIPPSPWLADGVLQDLEGLASGPAAEEMPIDAVISNGMGFGGQNTSVVFRKYHR